MATTRIVYTGDLRTENEHVRSGSVIITDAPVDNHGLGEAFSPTDLTATSLGACMLTVMGIKARQKEWDINGARCEVTKDMADSPRRIAVITVVVVMPQTLNTEQRILLERTAKSCPVAQSLSAEIELRISFSYE